jgi:hypothetical protein
MLQGDGVASPSRSCIWASVSIWLETEIATNCKPSSATGCLETLSTQHHHYIPFYKKAREAFIFCLREQQL